MRRALLAFGCIIVCSALPAAAQPPSLLTFTPAVLPAGATDPVLVEAELSTPPTRIAVEFSPRGANPTTIAMRDDGGGGDRIAGDNIYSARLPAGPILSARAEDDVFRVPIGFLDIFMGSTRTFHGNLYLMGLMPASEVRSQIVFADQAAVAGLRCTGQTFTGPITRVDAQTIIERYGAREPAYGEAAANFRSATVLVTRDGLATPEMMWLYSWMTERAEWRTQVPTQSGFAKQLGRPFHVATRGRGTIDVHIDRGQPEFALVPRVAEASVTAGEAAAYSILAQSRRLSFERDVTFSCAALPAGATCAFEPAAVVPGATGATTELRIATDAMPPGRYVVLVNAAGGDLRPVTAISLTVQ